MLVVLVGVTGWVLKGLMVTWHRLHQGDRQAHDTAASRSSDTEERLRKLESATSSLLVDVSGMREKQRFMARLQAGADAQAGPGAHPGSESMSPMVTQSVPIGRSGGR